MKKNEDRQLNVCVKSFLECDRGGGNSKTKKARIAPGLLRYDRLFAGLLKLCRWMACCYEARFRREEFSLRKWGLVSGPPEHRINNWPSELFAEKHNVCKERMGMLKKITCSVLAFFPCSLRVRSACQKGCELAGRTFLNSLQPIMSVPSRRWKGNGNEIFNSPGIYISGKTATDA